MTELEHLGALSAALVTNYQVLGICMQHSGTQWPTTLLSAAYHEDRLYLCTSSIGSTVPAREQHSPQYSSSSHRASTKFALEIDDRRH